MKSRWAAEEAGTREDGTGREEREGETATAALAYASRLLGAETSLVLHGGGNTSVKTPLADGTRNRRPGARRQGLGRRPGVDRAGGVRAARDGGAAAAASARRARRSRHGPRAAPRDALAGLRRPVDRGAGARLPAGARGPPHARRRDPRADEPARRGGRRTRGARRRRRSCCRTSSRVSAWRKRRRSWRRASPGAIGMVWSRHGAVAWGDDAREAYERMIEIVTRAERVPGPAGRQRAGGGCRRGGRPGDARAPARARSDPARRAVARERRRRPAEAADRPALADRSRGARRSWTPRTRGSLASTPPLTSDHLIRTKAQPLFLEGLAWDDAARLRGQVADAVAAYAAEYAGYIERGAERNCRTASFRSIRCRASCWCPASARSAPASDARAATIAADITAHTLAVKARVGGRIRGAQRRAAVRHGVQAAAARQARAPGRPRSRDTSR